MSTLIRNLLEQTGMTASQLAQLADVPERGLDAPSPQVLRRLAETLGMRLSELVAGQPPPAGGLFRTWLGEPGVLAELAMDGTAHRIGKLRQELVEVLALDERLGEALPALPAWATPAPPTDERDHGAAALAARVRDELGLGVASIPSIWALAARLGVHCAAVTPDDLPQHLDGVSWRSPAAIVVNRTGEWWRTRMTVAHELAHVLFDAGGFWISAAKGPSALWHHQQKLERRANAFAAYLLVPPQGARALIGAGPPTRAALVEVAQTYQVGLHVAANVLKHQWGLSEAERGALLYGHRSPGASREHADAAGPDSPTDQLWTRVERAMARGLLGEVRARALLGVPLSAPLPFGDHPPVLDALARVRLAVNEHLSRNNLDDLAVGEVRLDAAGYQVALVPAWGQPAEARPPLRVTRDFVVQ